MEHLQQQGKRLLAAFLALLLASSLLGVLPAAWAEPADDGSAVVDEAQGALDAAEERMAQINSEYEALSAQVDDLQRQIDESTASAMEAQRAMLEGRETLGEVAVGEYRDGNSANLLAMVMDSKSFGDLLRNVEYVNQIMDFQAEEVARQKERKQAFDDASAALNAKKNEQEAALAAQEQKRAEAQAVVDEASRHLDDAKADQAARLAELAAQAEAMKKAEEEERADVDGDDAGGNVEGATTVDRQEVVGDDAPVKPNPKPVEPDTGDDAGDVSDKPSEGSSSDAGGWKSGIASAYGGSTDPYTPNPGTTATGAICDDNSMGVAVPMSLPGYRKLFGRTVEISWNGKTVYATVNDCGSMRNGSRALDLQPGVWKAFGFSSCRAWGLRTVNYRFL